MPSNAPAPDALTAFSEATRAWFTASFPNPTAAQAAGWPAIARGDHTLLLAPTGSGKTLAAFLWMIDRLGSEPVPDQDQRCRVLYISPLRALAVDVDKNLRAPLAGIELAAQRIGTSFRAPTVGIRTGDTDTSTRAALARRPPDILITTPESLFLMLTSAARQTLRSVRWVIIDEIHALAPTKRGAHLALSLERLTQLCEHPPQRIGLSATQRPLDEMARYLGGTNQGRARPVTVVDAGSRKPLDLQVLVPVDDMSDITPPERTGGRADQIGTDEPGPHAGIWPHIHPQILELVRAHRTTLVFVNARRTAERLAARLNDLAGEDLVRAHHGSLSREQRLAVEDDLKAGRLRALVATSSLELGIDMGTVDLVVLVESPGSVARGLQRVGRAGHQVDEPSTGRIFPKWRGDLVEATAVARRMREGLVEEMRYPRNPIDVLAQQIVAAVSMDDWDEDALAALVRGAANFADLGDDTYAAVLDLLAGRYPSDRFSGLAPRLLWDRIEHRLHTRQGAQRVAVTNAGTIPDRGLFGVFLAGESERPVRVGELDEEMVYESRPGEVIALGASTWRIQEITFDRVLVTPAPGEPARVPFWRGDRPGRPLELGRALGAMVRTLRAQPEAEALKALAADGLDERARSNLLGYLAEQAEATGVVPDDRTVVVERFPDEIGDWRICILTPFGARVHAPWALAIEEHLARNDVLVQVMWSDDGIIARLPEALDDIPLDQLLPDPQRVEELVVARLPATSLFASRFRENAARALLLPRRRPGQRTPLWQQRQRAADLLEACAAYPAFPILLETTRECLRDVFDLPALGEVLRDVQSRRIRVVPVETRRASPFAQSLLFGWIAVYMYEGDAPLAERRAAALALDRDLLRELLGAEELRELLDAQVLAEHELELQRLVPQRQARDADGVADLVSDLGPLTLAAIQARCTANAADTAHWVDALVAARRLIRVGIGGTEHLAAAHDAARLRDALGVAIPVGLPAAFTDPVPRPLDELVARFARTHGPFTEAECAAALGTSADAVRDALGVLLGAGRVVQGEFRPGGDQREWCDDGVLRVVRRRSLAALRKEIEPVDAPTYARFLPEWHAIDRPRAGLDGLLDAVDQLQGCALPVSVLETAVLPLRVAGYRPAMLDELCAAGEVVWMGAGALGTDDGRIRLFARDAFAGLARLVEPGPDDPDSPLHQAVRAHLAHAGASFWPDLLAACANPAEGELLAALWDLVWAGEVTNDTLAPLRSLRAGGTGGPARRTARGARRRPAVGRLSRLGPPAAAGRWSLVGSRAAAPTGTAWLHATALTLLERHGVVTREAVRAEGIPGGFSALYPVLKSLEEAGRVRRGWFVAGLGAAQFALPGAVERLRSAREPGPDTPGALVLPAVDPAQPYGAALAWPDSRTGSGRPSRTAGASVVLTGGEPNLFVERGGRRLLTFTPSADPDTALQAREAAIEALAAAVRAGTVAGLQLERIDDEPARTSPLAEPLRAVGFADGYRGLTLRA